MAISVRINNPDEKVRCGFLLYSTMFQQRFGYIDQRLRSHKCRYSTILTAGDTLKKFFLDAPARFRRIHGSQLLASGLRRLSNTIVFGAVQSAAGAN